MPHSQTRHRNVAILTPLGFEKLQTAISKTDIWNNYTKSSTLETLSERTGLSTHTLGKVHARKAGVDLRTLVRYFHAFNLSLETSDYISPIRDDETLKPVQGLPFMGVQAAESKSLNLNVSWGMAPDVSVFYGRGTELATLNHWILEQRCRLVTLIGMGGIGKTWLATKLAEQTQHQFQSVIWRSLRPMLRPPSLNALLDDLIRHLAPQEPNLPETTSSKMHTLIDCLCKTRCLLVLDNVESILQKTGTEAVTETCWSNYEEYEELFRYFAQGRHQSCVILTSREEPKRIQQLAGDDLGVRVLPLQGLQFAEAQQLLRARGVFQGSPSDWSRLTTYYGGNPFFLEILALTIEQLFDGSLTAFLRVKNLILAEVKDFIHQQLEDLSPSEKEVVRVLANQDISISFTDLRSQISPYIPTSVLLAALKSLKTRSILEKRAAHFSLPPLLRDYLRDIVPRAMFGTINLDFTQSPPPPVNGGNREIC